MAEDVMIGCGGTKVKAVAANAEDTPPRRSKRWYVAWTLLQARILFPFYFQSMRLANEDRLPAEVSGPLIIYMNHPSWWDVLPIFLLQTMLLPRRVMYAPSEAGALSRGTRLPRIGFFPVERGTLKGTRQFFKDCSAILSVPDAVFCITPQGAFKDGRIRPLQLERGLASVLSRVGAVTVVPFAIEYTFWAGRRPELLASLGQPVHIEDGKSKSVDEWHAVLTEGLTAAMDELAELSIRRDMWKFRALVYGAMGPRNIKALIGDLVALSRRAP